MIIKKYLATKSADFWVLSETSETYETLKQPSGCYINVWCPSKVIETGIFDIHIHDPKSELSTPGVFTLRYDVGRNDIAKLIRVRDLEFIARFLTYPASDIVNLLRKAESEFLSTNHCFPPILSTANSTLYIGLIHLLRYFGMQ